MYNILYAIQCINILAIFTEAAIIFRRMRTDLHRWLFINCVVQLVNAVGILAEFGSTTRETYTTALRLSYLGRVWVALFLFMFVAELCGNKMPAALKAVLTAIHAGIYVTVFTIPKCTLFYTDYIFHRHNNVTHFAHSNGIAYHIFTILQVCYIIAGFTMLFIALHKEKKPAARKRLVMVICAISAMTVFYIVQISRILGEISEMFDVTVIGYTICTTFMYVAILRCDLLGTREIAREFMIDRLSEGIIAVDNDGVVRYLNEPAGELFPGLKNRAENILPGVISAASGGGNITLDEHIYKVEQTPLMHGGESYGMLYALVDETEHIRYMQELEKQKNRADSANQAKSAFLANMSHDIRTPINAVLGMNEMILRECDDRDILGYSEKIRSAGNTLLGLINDILDFSKIEAGKLDIIPVDYDLTSVLNDLVNMIQPRAEAKGLAFETRLDGSIPKLLHGDEIRIKQIVTNILTNAVKYTEKGSVTFALAYEKNGEDSILLRVSVTDTGIGIKPEDIPKLFTAFDRIEEERNRSIEGTGLGMSITQRLLAMMNSRLEVTSEYGSGSTFSFAIEQQVKSPEPMGDFEEALRRSLSNRRKYREKFTAPDAHILVVDDTPMNLEVFVNLLKKTLVRIDTASSGAECLALACRNKYDVIFLDHMMPDKNGIETLKELKASEGCPNAGTPAVCLTANAVSGARETYLNAGFDDYLTKPVEPEKLEDMLIKYLPEEKLLAAASADNCASGIRSVIPGFVRSCEEISVKQGIRHCGGEDIYLETLKTYAETLPGNTDKVEAFWNSGDIENFTIKVHALKSTSRVIGAMRLGDAAENLEAAGHISDTGFIAAHIDGLIERCRRLGEELAPLLDSGDKPLIPDDDLHEAFGIIREYLSVSDYNSALQIIDELSEYSFPEDEKQRCEELKRAASEFDYNAMKRAVAQAE
ncbi:MAG: response regulator [Ruminiclostridium sp.]|nr:response regulator [Ruminiclostridium sp.]